jgi:hypothetical protein
VLGSYCYVVLFLCVGIPGFYFLSIWGKYSFG